jgi:methanogenic corrinoid protein MtbC1
LLADDTEEAEELLTEYLEKQSVVEVYDRVVMPALALAEGDWHRDRLDEAKQASVRQSVRELVDEVGEKPRKADESQTTRYDRCILCLPARDPADEIAGMMLAQVLSQNGYCSENVSAEKLASEYLEMVETKKIQVVVISALPPAAVTHARYLVKRLRVRFPDLKIIVGLWTAQGSLERAKGRLESTGATSVVASLETAIEQIRQTVLPLVVTEKADAKASEREVAALP